MEKKIKVVAIQLKNQPNEFEKNMKKAENLIRKVADEGGEMFFLPELYSNGYYLSDKIWQYAESVNGRTFELMSALAKEKNIWIGIGIVETDGNEIYNTYLLINHLGELVTAIRKNKPEAYYFKRGKYPRVIKTPFGKIGIAICADNHYKDLVEEYYREGVDLAIMPHAWFIPKSPKGLVSIEDYQETIEKTKDMGPLLSRALGIPTIFINPVGEFENCGESIHGLMGKYLTPSDYHFPGFSTISNAEGKIITQLNNEENYTIAEISIDKRKKKNKIDIPYFGQWIHPGPKARDLIFGIDIFFGKLFYRYSKDRKEQAQKRFN